MYAAKPKQKKSLSKRPVDIDAFFLDYTDSFFILYGHLLLHFHLIFCFRLAVFVY